MYLETERLLLEEFTAHDFEFIQRLDRSPQVMKFISNGIPADLKENNRAMNIFLNYNKEYQHKFGYWKVIEKETQNILGWFHLRPLKSAPKNLDEVELGYRFLESAWGKGYATEGSKALLLKAKELKVKKLWAQAMKNNESSTNVMKKIGMTFSHVDKYEDWPGEDKTTVWYLKELI